VVKNVAGFDLVRLATGSLGALGLVTEVIFRLYPLPEDDRTLVWSATRAAEAWDLGRSLSTLPIPLAAAELVGGRKDAPLDDSGFRVMIRLLGSRSAVARMREILLEKAGLPVREVQGAESAAGARILARDDAGGEIAFRVHTLPDRGRAVAAALDSVPVGHLALHLLQGTYRGTLSAGSDLEALGPVGRAARSSGGSLRVTRAPGEIPPGIETGPARAAAVARLHAGIARGFDPGGLLPGSWREGWE
jgi:glycolate oxidase FAD binding subunit